MSPQTLTYIIPRNHAQITLCFDPLWFVAGRFYPHDCAPLSVKQPYTAWVTTTLCFTMNTINIATTNQSTTEYIHISWDILFLGYAWCWRKYWQTRSIWYIEACNLKTMI